MIKYLFAVPWRRLRRSTDTRPMTKQVSLVWKPWNYLLPFLKNLTPYTVYMNTKVQEKVWTLGLVTNILRMTAIFTRVLLLSVLVLVVGAAAVQTLPIYLLGGLVRWLRPQ